jgi:hypothetical protein
MMGLDSEVEVTRMGNWRGRVDRASSLNEGLASPPQERPTLTLGLTAHHQIYISEQTQYMLLCHFNSGIYDRVNLINTSLFHSCWPCGEITRYTPPEQ